MAFSIGIDLGGTKIAGALVDEELNILAEEKIPVDREKRVDKVIGDMELLIRNFKEKGKGECLGIGLALPGLLDWKKGGIVLSENLNWRNVPVIPLLKEKLSLPFLMEHDVRSGAIAEVYFGAARLFQDILYVSVGTGIAGSLIWKRNIIRGAHEASAELGHMVIEPDGPLCRCGNVGCLETLASGNAMERDVFHLSGEYMKGEEIFKRAQEGIFPYQEVVKRASSFLGLGLFNLVQIFDPEVIILGGGVAEAGDWWLEMVKEGYENRFFWTPTIPPLVLGRFRGKASVMGAAGLPILQKRGEYHQSVY